MKGKLHFFFITFSVFIGIATTVMLLVIGTDYYSLPVEHRFFSIKHTYLKPSGVIGHGIGILGSLMMIIGVLSYMIRKRLRLLFQIGFLKNWLEFHIFMCTVGPILVLFHTAFKFGGIVAISFWSMVVVVLSGFLGRFIYTQIPRTIQGHELTAEELSKTELDLIIKMKEEYSLSEKILSQLNSFNETKEYLHFSLWESISTLFQSYFLTKNVVHQLKSDLASEGIYDKTKIKMIVRIAKAKLTLTRRIGTLRTMQKFFRYWHIFHLPFALSMFIIMIIHVVITITFGYKWIF